MKTVMKTVEPADRQAKFDHIRPLYLDALTLVERLHRRLLDVIKDEFDRRGRADINSVQALLLYNIGDKELTAGELRTRGYYLGSNVSYNLKKLVEMGFLDHQRSRVDRRSVRIRLTDSGRESITLTIQKVDAEAIGKLIALYERAVGFYGQLVHINAYHQPGVEAGKKAAAAVLELQGKVMGALQAHKGQPLTLEQAAQAAKTDDVETVFWVLRHLAANPEKQVKRTLTQSGNPFDATYTYAG